MEKNVCIVNFNTTELTRAAILSLLRHTPDANVTVFDNSDRIPFPKMKGVRIIDNTKGQIIDFELFLNSFPYRSKSNQHGSAKHTRTIDKLFEYFPNGFVLMDSDVLITQDISCFFDYRYGYAGTLYSNSENKQRMVLRLLPFLCWINVPMCKRYNIRYFDPKRSWKLDIRKKSLYDLYDTGASFTEDCRHFHIPYKHIDINEYMVHFRRGSWDERDCSGWLEKYKYLYA